MGVTVNENTAQYPILVNIAQHPIYQYHSNLGELTSLSQVSLAKFYHSDFQAKCNQGALRWKLCNYRPDAKPTNIKTSESNAI